ncbi:MAG TPA: hypothetical protein VJ820_15860 [Propionibacteriaceae bacterium]|nr:hypothetical protein [Propionibacteriaceae bacterium]
MLLHDALEVLRLMRPPKPIIAWLLRILVDPPPPLVEQLWVFAKKSFANSRIKITHARPSYEQAAT